MSNISSIAGYFAAIQSAQPTSSQSTSQTGSSSSFGPAFTFDFAEMSMGSSTPSSYSSNGASASSIIGGGMVFENGNAGASSSAGGNFEEIFAAIFGTAGSNSSSSSSSTTQASTDSSTTGISNSNSTDPSGLNGIFQILQQMLTAMNNYIDGTGTTGTQAASSATGSTFGSSPMDQFLTQMGASGTTQGGTALTSDQQTAIQNILTQYQNAPDTPQTFQQVNSALQQAGISMPHHHHHHGASSSSASNTPSTSSSSTTPVASTTPTDDSSDEGTPASSTTPVSAS